MTLSNVDVLEEIRIEVQAEHWSCCPGRLKCTFPLVHGNGRPRRGASCEIVQQRTCRLIEMKRIFIRFQVRQCLGIAGRWWPSLKLGSQNECNQSIIHSFSSEFELRKNPTHPVSPVAGVIAIGLTIEVLHR